MTRSYSDFLKAKVCLAASTGFDVSDADMSPVLKPHQRAIVRWMVAGGRRACFAAFGLGKSAIQIEAVRLTRARAGGRGLIVHPLGVRHEFDHDGGDEALPLFDRPVPVHAGARDTERAAARRIAPIAGTLRATVLEWVRDAGPCGLTAKEGGRRYARSLGREADDGSARYSIAPRLTELSKAGYVVDSGQRREGAIVWRAEGKRES